MKQQFRMAGSVADHGPNPSAPAAMGMRENITQGRLPGWTPWDALPNTSSNRKGAGQLVESNQ